MTFKYEQNKIESFETHGFENFYKEAYIGYFSPEGNLINFNNLLGNSGHDEWSNPVSWTFLNLVSYIIQDTSISKIKEEYIKLGMADLIEYNEYPGLDEYVIRGYKVDYEFNYKSYDYFLKNLDEYWDYYSKIRYLEGYDKFKYDLLKFFKNAYNNKNFFENIQRKIIIENLEKIKEHLNLFNHFDDYALESLCRQEVIKQLLSYAKDIYVQYLGYDSLERFNTDYKPIEIKNGEKYDFSNIKRVITTASSNPIERYYNYLLMDWVVHKVPKYNFNEKTKKYEKSEFNLYYQSEKEEILENEIKSLKKCIPLEQRHKYFR